MEKLVLLMVVLATCYAAPQDLSGKVFVFSKETKTDYVKLQTSKTRFSAVTTCLRFQTDLSRDYSLFSLATTTHNNAFLFFKRSSDPMNMQVQDVGTDFLSVSLAPNTWHSMCGTWSSGNGVSQLWVDGKATIKRFIKTGIITGAPIVILGQDQDSYGGTFVADQSFIGMISNVHMWDSVLPAAEIKSYMDGRHFTPGNVFNWRALEYVMTGHVAVEEESEVM